MQIYMVLKNLRQLTPIVNEAFDQTLRVAKFLCYLHVTNTYICSFIMAQGPSMLPTINLTGNIVLAERLSTRFGKVGSGDVILIRSPIEPRKIMVKRIVGVAGDAVSYSSDDDLKEATVVVPKGHIWIEGDNKQQSRDSRTFGPVPCGHVQAKVFCVVWPPRDFRLMNKRIP